MQGFTPLPLLTGTDSELADRKDTHLFWGTACTRGGPHQSFSSLFSFSVN